MARLDWTTFIIFHFYYLSLSFVTIITTLPFAEAGLDDSKKRIFKVLKRTSFLFILYFYSFNLGVCVVHLEIFYYFIVPTLKYLALNPGNLVWKPPVCLLWEALYYYLKFLIIVICLYPFIFQWLKFRLRKLVWFFGCIDLGHEIFCLFRQSCDCFTTIIQSYWFT